MDRRVQVEEGGVGEPLPAIVVGVDDDPALPELGPLDLVLAPQLVEAIRAGHGHDPRCRSVGILVEPARDEAGDLPQPVATAGLGPHPVVGRERALEPPVRLLLPGGRVATQLGDVRHPALGEAAEGQPAQRAVDEVAVAARRLGVAPDRPAVHVVDVDERPQLEIARRRHLDGDLLERERGPLLAAEREDLDVRGGFRSPESEPRRELAGREVIGLVDELGEVRRRDQPDVVDREVAAKGIRGIGCRFDLHHGMEAGEAVHHRHARKQRDVDDAQADDAVRDVGGQLVGARGRHGLGAEGCGHASTVPVAGLSSRRTASDAALRSARKRPAEWRAVRERGR